MAVRRVLFCRQHNGKFRTPARLRNQSDIAALPRYDLAGQIQANAHALLFVYLFLTIEAPENGGLIAFGNALTLVLEGEYSMREFMDGIDDMVKGLVQAHYNISDEQRAMFGGGAQEAKRIECVGKCPSVVTFHLDFQ